MTTADIAPADLAAVNVRDDGLLKVAAGSNVADLAAAIAHAVYAGHAPKLRAVGAGAVNQAVKAIAVASGYVAPTGRTLACRPGFENIQSRDGQISSITLQVLVG
jgi:stage V sporulation protein S